MRPQMITRARTARFLMAASWIGPPVLSKKTSTPSGQAAPGAARPLRLGKGDAEAIVHNLRHEPVVVSGKSDSDIASAILRERILHGIGQKLIDDEAECYRPLVRQVMLLNIDFQGDRPQ